MMQKNKNFGERILPVFFLMYQQSRWFMKKLGFKWFMSGKTLISHLKKKTQNTQQNKQLYLTPPFPPPCLGAEVPHCICALLPSLMSSGQPNTVRLSSRLENEGGCKAYSNFSFSTQHTVYEQC